MNFTWQKNTTDPEYLILKFRGIKRSFVIFLKINQTRNCNRKSRLIIHSVLMGITMRGILTIMRCIRLKGQGSDQGYIMGYIRLLRQQSSQVSKIGTKCLRVRVHYIVGIFPPPLLKATTKKHTIVYVVKVYVVTTLPERHQQNSWHCLQLNRFFQNCLE